MIRVLITSPNPILGQGLEAWLRQQRDLDVVGWESDATQVSARIGELMPDVVIVDTCSAEKTPLAALMRLLADRPGAKIVAVNLYDNSVCIYSGEQHAIEHVMEFLEAIRREPAG